MRGPGKQQQPRIRSRRSLHDFAGLGRGSILLLLASALCAVVACRPSLWARPASRLVRMTGAGSGQPPAPVQLSDEAKQKVKDQLKPLVKPATRLALSPVGDERPPITRTCFGGAPYLEKGEKWPSCAKCSQPLSFICQLNMKDRQDPGLPTQGLYTVFYCMNCFPWGSEPECQGQWLVKYYPKPKKKSAIKAQDASKPETRTKPCIVKSEAIVSCPPWESLERLAPQVDKFLRKEAPQDPYTPYDEVCLELTKREEDHMGTQIGGYPRWIQNEERPVCLTCKKELVLLAQLDSEEAAGLMWGDAGCLYFFVCPEHPANVHMTMQCY